jgi:hypothetical protein
MLYQAIIHNDVDYIPNPTRGFLAELSLKRKGFGIQSPVNLWEFQQRLRKHGC